MIGTALLRKATDGLSAADLKIALEESGFMHKLFEALLGESLREGENQMDCPSGHASEGHKCFNLNTQKGVWKCHHCGLQGDVFSLLIEFYGMDFKKAFDYLKSQLSGIDEEELKELVKVRKERGPEPPKVCTSNEADVAYWEHLLYEPQMRSAVLDFLYGRGITDEGIKHFRLGAGFITVPPNWKPVPAVMIPLYNGTNDLAAVKAYHYEQGKEKVPNTDGSSKQMLNFARLLEPPTRDWVFLCAGEMDAIRLWQELPENLVLGTACGESTWDSEWNLAFAGKTVALLYDSDDTGRKGASKVIEQLKPYVKGIANVNLFPQPDKDHKDVTDYFREGGTIEGFLQIVNTTPLEDKTVPISETTMSSEIATPKEPEPDPVVAAIEELNKKYALAKFGSGVVIIDETDPIQTNFMQVHAWQIYMANEFVSYMKDMGEGSTKRVNKPIAQYWLEHTMRREYNKVVFAIEGARDGEYNLWKGFGGIKSSEGQWNRIEYHIKEIICSGDRAAYDYLLLWLGHLLQKPWEKPGVSIVMRGGRGVGKGMFANDIVRPMIGDRSFLAVEKAEHLTGKFNHHLSHCLVVFADEAFFAGDRREQKALNNVITEPYMMIEPKRVDPFPVRSYHRVIMAGNPHWIVNAGKDERRFLVLQVSDKHKQDPKYFEPLAKSIVQELPAFRWFLEHMDISNFDRYNAPKTAALMEQIVESRESFDGWYHQVIEDRQIYIMDGSHGAETPFVIVDWDARQLVGSRKDVYKSFVQYCQQQKDPRPLNEERFGVRLHKLELKNKPGKKWVTDVRPIVGGRQVRSYQFNT